MILPLTVLRRVDCVLAPTKEKVLATNARFKGKLENLDPQLRKASGFAFYNTSRYDFEKRLVSQKCLGHNWLNSLFYTTQAVQSPILFCRPTSWNRRAGGGPPKAPAESARGLPALRKSRARSGTWR